MQRRIADTDGGRFQAKQPACGPDVSAGMQQAERKEGEKEREEKEEKNDPKKNAAGQIAGGVCISADFIRYDLPASARRCSPLSAVHFRHILAQRFADFPPRRFRCGVQHRADILLAHVQQLYGVEHSHPGLHHVRAEKAGERV